MIKKYSKTVKEMLYADLSACVFSIDLYNLKSMTARTRICDSKELYYFSILVDAICCIVLHTISGARSDSLSLEASRLITVR